MPSGEGLDKYESNTLYQKYVGLNGTGSPALYFERTGHIPAQGNVGTFQNRHITLVMQMRLIKFSTLDLLVLCGLSGYSSRLSGTAPCAFGPTLLLSFPIHKTLHNN